MIPESHPLQQLFIELVGRHYAEEIGIRDPQIVNYVSHLLAEFCDAEQLFKIRNAAGKPSSANSSTLNMPRSHRYSPCCRSISNSVSMG